MSMKSWMTHGACVLLGLLAGGTGSGWLLQQAYGSPSDRAASDASGYATLLFDREGRPMAPGQTRALLEQWVQAPFLVAAVGYEQLDPVHRDLLRVATARFAEVDAAQGQAGTDAVGDMARAARGCIRSGPADRVGRCATRRHAQILDAYCIARDQGGACAGIGSTARVADAAGVTASGRTIR